MAKIVLPGGRIAAALERTKLSDLVGREVKLVKRGREYVGLCPFHSEKTPSFHVVEDKGFYHCFGCGAHGDAIEWTMAIAKLSFAEAIAALDGGMVMPAAEIEQKRTERRREADERRRSYRDLARDLWRESAPIAGTPGEGYFRGRGITVALPPTLRYHRAVALGSGAQRIRLPAVVAAVQGPDGLVDAVHRIFLDPGSIAAGRPRKAAMEQGKALLGTVKGGAVRFAAAAPIMGTCEGIETGLAIIEALPDLALWSGIDATHMAAITWPPPVRELIIFADRDRVSTTPGKFFGKRPGEYWAERAAVAFITSNAGRIASIVVPPGEKADFLDLLLAE